MFQMNFFDNSETPFVRFYLKNTVDTRERKSGALTKRPFNERAEADAAPKLFYRANKLPTSFDWPAV